MALPVVEVCVLLFLILGLFANAWKWAWILFVLDVFYYWFIGVYVKGKEDSDND